MRINFWLNGVKKEEEICPDTLLLDFLRSLGCYSVKCGCETANCGLCTVSGGGKTCAFLRHACWQRALRDARVDDPGGSAGRRQRNSVHLIADEGAEQCGFCNPGFIMNVIAMTKELTDPTEDEIKEYLAGSLCRCSGFVGQTRSILKYLEYKKNQEKEVQA